MSLNMSFDFCISLQEVKKNGQGLDAVENGLLCWQFLVGSLWAPAFSHISAKPENCCENRNESVIVVIFFAKTAYQQSYTKVRDQRWRSLQLNEKRQPDIMMFVVCQFLV